ncbi:MAG: hypothetical protein KDF60_19920 [Calditrichaeota bacterium]|nr:hypothetical protein [Calditrichota bacterium]MCB0471819.1 hypothetical protein [Flavobacteriaceae bacterium]
MKLKTFHLILLALIAINTSFYSQVLHKSNAVVNDKIWLNLYNDQGAFSQILIGFIPEATNGIDRNYDAVRFFGSNPVAFYSVVDSVYLAIQGRAPRTEPEKIPLGVYTSVDNIPLKIIIDELQGSLTDPAVSILIEDKELNTRHDLKNSEYNFEISSSGYHDNRFNLIIKSADVLSISDYSQIAGLRISKNYEGVLLETTDGTLMTSLRVYDLLGKSVFESYPNQNKITLDNTSLPYGKVLLFKVKMQNTGTVTKKILFL